MLLHCFRIPDKLFKQQIFLRAWIQFVKSEETPFTSSHSFRNFSLDSFPTWDHNWDKLLHKKNKGLKRFVLVRTGQSERKSAKTEGTVLSKLGERQAKSTGERLKQLYPKLDSVICAPLLCCQKTAHIIVSEFKGKQPNIDFSKNSSFIEVPLPADPPIPNKITDEIMMYRGLPLIEAAFRNVCYRPVKDGLVSHLIVAESNFIRFFICRALQLPIDHWVRFTVKHCSISEVFVQFDGSVRLRCVGEAAHLLKDLRSC